MREELFDVSGVGVVEGDGERDTANGFELRAS